MVDSQFSLEKMVGIVFKSIVKYSSCQVYACFEACCLVMQGRDERRALKILGSSQYCIFSRALVIC